MSDYFYMDTNRNVTNPKTIAVLERLDDILERLYVRLGTNWTENIFNRVNRLEDYGRSLMADPDYRPCECCGLVHVEEQVVNKAQLGYDGTTRMQFLCDECNEDYV